MKKNAIRKKSVLFVAIMCALCGCAKTPNVRDENGINYEVLRAQLILEVKE